MHLTTGRDKSIQQRGSSSYLRSDSVGDLMAGLSNKVKDGNDNLTRVEGRIDARVGLLADNRS